MTIDRLFRLLPCLLAGACTTAPGPASEDLGTTWVLNSAEYEALALQAYRAAGDALEEKLADPDWSALPEQVDAGDLPPAIILDVDETVVSNVEFQLALVPPFTEEKFNAYNATHAARPVPGVAEFARRARELGIELFFVTNRACSPDPVTAEPCPQKDVTAQDIREAGVPVSADRVMLSFEQPGWNKEKKNRRDVVARDYRVLMLIGDDLNDFIACSRSRAIAPCIRDASIESRARSVAEHRDYWGNGWYVLPNPMHGSWTSVQ